MDMKEGLGGVFKRTINIFALITRYFFGILFVIAGLSAIFIHKNGFDSLNFLSGLVFLMLGVALTPILNKYFFKAASILRDFYLKIDNQYNKHIKAYSLLLFLFFTIGLWVWLFSQFNSNSLDTQKNNYKINNNTEEKVFYVLKKGETEIPRSYPEPFKCILVSKSKKGNMITTVSKQVGRTTLDYRKSVINCGNFTFKILESGESLKMTKVKNPQWTEIVDGSSMADMVYFVCN